jgi:uncharacterized protein YecA (UPF0149 family)
MEVTGRRPGRPSLDIAYHQPEGPMGAIADAIVTYAQPLIDSTDGSADEIERAFALGQLCWNLALLPEAQRDESLAEMRSTLEMDDDEYEEFRQTVLIPMIRRHEEMFPNLHRRNLMGSSGGWAASPSETKPSRGGKYPGTGRYDPCPCHSGEKYKFCCGKK